jgi:cell fate regulator YaaT (PSP1 superfamily)
MITHTEDQSPTVPSLVAGVRFFEVGKVYHFSCDHLTDILAGDQVIVETSRGSHLGQVMNLVTVSREEATRDYKPILRKATPTDLMNQKLWKSRETEALITCREKAAEQGGMVGTKFVAAQYNFDGSLLTILFTADEKLNTTKLRTNLQRGFKAKIELRQVGPRDVAKLLGGMGACGIPRCCSTFLTDFSPISIKMAKAQGISLNPSEITGMCGRLRCCLIYEYEQYVEARKQLPKRNKRVGTPHGEGKVIDVHPLRDAVTVLIEDTQYIVEREQIIPLEEWEALKGKAESGCSKNEAGACDCGQHKSAAPVEDQVNDEIESESPPEPRAQSSRPEVESHNDIRREPRSDQQPDRNKPRRGKGKRPRHKRGPNNEGKKEQS